MLEMERMLELGNVADFDAVMAFRQTAGRGRLMRAWHTGAGNNLAVSFWVSLETDKLSPLPLVTALAVIDSLNGSGLAGQLQCKWPNDIKVQGRKICGILCQYAENPKNQSSGSIVGVGINLDLSETEIKAVDQPITSLKTVTGLSIPPKEMCAVLQFHIEERVRMLRNEGFSSMAAEWYGFCGHAGKLVSVDTGFSVFTGLTKGLDKQGALLMECGGMERRIICGDVSHNLRES